ncbi:MAG: hypothetical protein AAFO07_01500, partial [Bacteroidota bacterium]
MKKQYNHIYILFAALLLSISLNAQDQIRLRVSPQLLAPSTAVLSNSDRDNAVRELEAFLNTYAQLATLRDEEAGGQVTENSVRNFRDIFNPSASIVKDFVENIPQGGISLREYTDQVFGSRLRVEGLQFNINEAELLEIRDIGGGFLSFKVKVVKIFYNYLGSDARVVNGVVRPSEQNIYFEVPVSDLADFQVGNIERVCKGKECDPADEYVNVYSLDVGAGLSLPSTTLSAYATGTNGLNAPNLLDVGSGLVFSAGVGITTNRLVNPESSSKKALFLNAGVRASIYSIETTFQRPRFELANQTVSGAANYDRIVNAHNGVEDMTVINVEVPVGLGYRLLETRKSMLLLNVSVVPTLNLSASGSYSGTGSYDGKIQELRFLRDGAVNE